MLVQCLEISATVIIYTGMMYGAVRLITHSVYSIVTCIKTVKQGV